MESSGKPSALLPTVLGNESVCVFHLCLPCMCSLTHGRSQLYVTHEEYSGALEVIDDSSLGNEWLTKKDIHGREQHAQQFLSFEEKKMFKNVWGETDFSGARGICKHLPLLSPGCGEEEEERGRK